MTPEKLDLIGAAEIMERHGIPHYRIARFLKRGLWPTPLARLKCGDVYDGGQVATAVAMLRQSDRL